MNALKLCTTVLELPLEPDEAMSFLYEIASTCDQVEEMVQRLQLLPESCWHSSSPPVSLASAQV